MVILRYYVKLIIIIREKNLFSNFTTSYAITVNLVICVNLSITVKVVQIPHIKSTMGVCIKDHFIVIHDSVTLFDAIKGSHFLVYISRNIHRTSSLFSDGNYLDYDLVVNRTLYSVSHCAHLSCVMEDAWVDVTYSIIIDFYWYYIKNSMKLWKIQVTPLLLVQIKGTERR